MARCRGSGRSVGGPVVSLMHQGGKEPSSHLLLPKHINYTAPGETRGGQFEGILKGLRGTKPPELQSWPPVLPTASPGMRSGGEGSDQACSSPPQLPIRSRGFTKTSCPRPTAAITGGGASATLSYGLPRWFCPSRSQKQCNRGPGVSPSCLDRRQLQGEEGAGGPHTHSSCRRCICIPRTCRCRRRCRNRLGGTPQEGLNVLKPGWAWPKGGDGVSNLSALWDIATSTLRRG